MRIAIVLALLLGVCARTDTAGPKDQPLDGRSFLSRAVTGHTLVPGTQVRLTFDDGRIGASAGCNMMGATYAIEDGVLVLDGAMSMTEMGCDQPRHEQDDWLSAFLGSSPTVTLAGDGLDLTAGSTTIELLDREVVDPDRPLVGTTWRIDSVMSGDTVSSVPDQNAVLLRFPDERRFVVEAPGCTSATGSMRVGEGMITFEQFAVDDIGCPGPWNDTLKVLRSGETTYSIEAARLTIESDEIGISAIAREM